MISRKLIALLIVVGMPATLMIWYRVHQSSGFAPLELIVYPLLFGGLSIVAILLLQRFYLKQPLSEFNRGTGTLLTDGLWGVALTAVYFLLFVLERPLLGGILESRPNMELLGLMLDMRQHPWMLVIWFGPVLWIGVALYEELVRTFLLNKLWSFSPAMAWVVASVVLSALIIGLTHWSQGPYGVVTIGIKSLVAGMFYYRVQRLLPLVLAHVLYDGIQVALPLLTYPE